MSPRKRLLLLAGNTDDRNLLAEQLRSKLPSLGLLIASTLDEAQKIIIDQGCDLILVSLGTVSGEAAASLIRTLQSYSADAPTLVVVRYGDDHTASTDLLVLGVCYILDAADVEKDPGRLVGAVAAAVRDLRKITDSRDALAMQVKALSRKIWDVDQQVQRQGEQVARDLEGLQKSIEELTAAVNQRGGLEDRIERVERDHSLARQIFFWAGGVIATLATFLATLLSGFLPK